MLKAQPSYPKMPFVLMNEHHILLFGGSTLTFDGTWRVIGEQAYLRGRFKQDAVAIDVDCRKYPLLDVINLGRVWSPFDLWWLFRKDRPIKVKYVFGEPVQLTFDEARHEIVELICSRKWYGQTGGTEKHFRETRAQARDMKEFLVGRYGIGFYGRWMMHYNPPTRRLPKKTART